MGALDGDAVPARGRGSELHAVPREGVNLGVANGEVAHGVRDNAVCIGPPAGGVQRMVDETAVDEDPRGGPDIDEVVGGAGVPRCSATERSARCWRPGPHRRAHTARRGPGPPR